MITPNDVIDVEMNAADVAYAKANPVEGHKNVLTGQLKTLGNMALMRVLGITQGEFLQQLEAARYLDSTYVCETRNGDKVGIDPAVLFVKDDNVMNKNIVVPANQLFTHRYLNDRYTVAVFVRGTKDPGGELGTVSHVSVAGWVQAGKLKRWISKDRNPLFAAKNVSLAIAPCQVVLLPMQHLLTEVGHHDAMP